MGKTINVSIHKHRSAKSIVYDFYDLNKKYDVSTQVNLKQFTGKKEYGPIRVAVDIVKKKKVWGFYRNGNPLEICIWANKDCGISNVMNLISHEVAHSAGYRSENSAIKISAISTFSLYIVSLYFKDMLKITSDDFKNIIE
jgi:hypothetical protein